MHYCRFCGAKIYERHLCLWYWRLPLWYNSKRRLHLRLQLRLLLHLRLW